MASELIPRGPRVRRDRARLRVVALLAGGALGLTSADIDRFAEDLTGRPLRSCRTAELWMVIDEFGSLVKAITEKERRRAARATRPAPSWGWPDVSPN